MAGIGRAEATKTSTGQRLLRWIVVLAQGVLLVIAWYSFSDQVRVSPGPLISMHGKEASLDGSAGCKVCHGPKNGACTAETCAACHSEIRSQIVARKGFHGILDPGRVEDCGRCHGEHQGAAFPAVNAKSFQLAGIPEVLRYAHEGLDFHLEGRHRSLECRKCHPAAEAVVLEKGQKRYLGAVQDCVRCHQDVHQGAFGKDCRACHGQEHPFKSAAAFHHPEAFPLSGSHSGLACIVCHAEGTPSSIPSLLGVASKGKPPAAVRTCGACHPNPHSDEFIARSSAAARVPPASSCTVCHSGDHATFFGPTATLTRKQHSATGFLLESPHQKPACAACHAGFGTPFPQGEADRYHERYPGRRAEDCRACHGDPHRGDFEAGAFKGKDCLSCHAPKAFAPALFDVARHDQTAFRLEGKHRKIQCSQCHAKGSDGTPPRYHGTPADCRACHQDPHRGAFDRPEYGGNDCRRCHTQEAFKPPTFTVAMHATTSFALTGAHLAINCSRCHEKAPARNGEAGVPVFAGLSGKCSSCHTDVHAGKFDGPELPSVVAGRTDCARCHGTDGFRSFAGKGFDHARWTGYGLNGSHAKLECAACHGRNAPDPVKGRTLGFAAGRSCQSCHADPHAGQFGPTLTVSCTKCHTENRTFRELTFDHRKDSRFALDEVHVKLACAQCHKPTAVAPGTTAVRYKPLGIQCADCHDPKGPRKQP